MTTSTVTGFLWRIELAKIAACPISLMRTWTDRRKWTKGSRSPPRPSTTGNEDEVEHLGWVRTQVQAPRSGCIDACPRKFPNFFHRIRHDSKKSKGNIECSLIQCVVIIDCEIWPTI